MAKSTELIQTIADAIGTIPAPTVALHDRFLMEAGLRTRGKRGRGASDMTARDAANVLLSVLASPIAGPRVGSSIERWRLYAELGSDGGFVRTEDGNEKLDSRWQLPGFEIQHLTSLPAGHSASDALTAIIASIGDRTFHKALGIDPADPLFRYSGMLRVELHFPVPRIEIRFAKAIHGRPKVTESHGYYFGGSADAQAEEAYRRAEAGDESWSGDMQEVRRISLLTLGKLGMLIGGEQVAEGVS